MKNIELKKENFIAIADWMISDFDFNTRELLCYAIIYGFSQDGESVFSGSLNYLASWLKIQRNNVLRYLNSLVEKGVVIKEKKSSANKTWCEYKALASKGVVKSTDHIVILPWMITELGLQDKELILYALIYGFSRIGSNSVFSGNNAYMGKWLNINKANVNRYTSSLIKKGLIERKEDSNSITYKAIVPEKKDNHFENTPNQNENTIIKIDHNQIENTPNQIENDSLIKMRTNTLINNLDNNLNVVVSDPFCRIENVIKSSLDYQRYVESGTDNALLAAKTLKHLIDIIKTLSEKKQKAVFSLTDAKLEDLFRETLKADENLYESFFNPNGYVISKIFKAIKKEP